MTSLLKGVQKKKMGRPKKANALTNLEKQHRFRARQRDVAYTEPENLRRRRRLEKQPLKWLKYYLPDAFPLPWAQFHINYVKDILYIIKHGGWKSEALPRGSGKTTIAQGITLLAILAGWMHYSVLLAATAGKAQDMIKTFKSWLLNNDRLLADYPEVCAPIRKTKGIAQATQSLTAFGKPIHMEWTARKLVLPDAPRITPSGKLVPADSAGAIIDCDGLTGSLRGRQHTLPSGEMIRPDVVIPDDPQTKESARSPKQTQDRLSIIKSDIAGMGGPSKDVRIIIPCTVIEAGDLADQITNPELNPDFLGERLPFFLSMPKNMELWNEYNNVRIEGLNKRDKGKASIAYYKANREALEEGAMVSWPERKGDNAICGIQWGMNEYFKLGEEAFYSELQNQPQKISKECKITLPHVLACETDRKRGQVPEEHYYIAAMSDINHDGVRTVVCSFGADMSAAVLAYQKYPERGELVPENASATKKNGLIFSGLEAAHTWLKGLPLMRGKDPARINTAMIDGGYSWETVIQFSKCARFPFEVVVDRGRSASRYLDQGRGVLKAMYNVHLRQNPKGERYLSHNADYWREVVQLAFIAGANAPGGISLHRRPPDHTDFGNHITGEILVDKAEGVNGMLYKWTRVPGSKNDYLDCVVGCYAAAAWSGQTNVPMPSGIAQENQRPGRRKIKIRQVRL